MPEMTGLRAVVAVLTLICAAGCAGDSGLVDVFTMAEWIKIATFSPLPAVPADLSNRFADDARAAAFGQRLFFEKALSGPLAVSSDGMNGSVGMAGDAGKVACATCHVPDAWFLDNNRSQPNNTTLGANWTPRSNATVTNVAFYEIFGRGGKSDTLWMQATATSESVTMGSTRLRIAHVVYDRYKADYNALFQPPLDPALDPQASDGARFPASGKPKKAATDPDGPWEMMAEADRQIVNTIYANYAKALAAYERKLLSRDAPFDRYAAGDYGAISAAAKRGLRLFIGKAACDGCHSGPFFADQTYHVTGVPQTGPHVPATDTGHYDDLKALLASPFNSAGAFSDDRAGGQARLAKLGAPGDDDIGAFRTKNLREVAMVAPYMHTGMYKTLNDVLAFYNMGGATTGFSGVKDPKQLPLDLGAGEISDLIEFLRTLTGAPVAGALWADTSAK